MTGPVAATNSEEAAPRGSGRRRIAVVVACLGASGLGAAAMVFVFAAARRTTSFPLVAWVPAAAVAGLFALGALATALRAAGRIRVLGVAAVVAVMIAEAAVAVAAYPRVVSASLTALDAQTGRVDWTVRPGLVGIDSISGNGTVVDLSGGRASGACNAIGVHGRLKLATGQLSAVSDAPPASPSVDPGASVVGDSAAGAAALVWTDASGATRWRAPLASGGPYGASLAPVASAAGRIVLAVSGVGARARPATAVAAPAPPAPDGAPAVRPIAAPATAGTIVVVDATTGSEVWRHDASTKVATVTADNSTVFALDGDLRIDALDLATGHATATTPAPALSSGWIIAGDSTLVAVDPTTGTLRAYDDRLALRWQTELPGLHANRPVDVFFSGGRVLVAEQGHTRVDCSD